MNILVWGLGYVGTVTGACLGNLGHIVLGIDSDDSKVAMIQAGRSPVMEPGLDDLVAALRQSDSLRATGDGSRWVNWADASLICVGTPSSDGGELQTEAVARVAAQIAEAMRVSHRPHTVVVRSTMPPGGTRTLILPILERYSGRSLGNGFGLIYNPEFLRETTAVADFATPAYTVAGVQDDFSAQMAAGLSRGIAAPFHRVTFEEAELLKLTCNAFHALKIGFANEIGRIARPLNIDAENVMRLLCADTKLNLSSAYLRPGFAFGGSCLPKDVRAMTAAAHQENVYAPLIGALLGSNQEQIRAAFDIVQAARPRQVAILGLGFKAHTNDVRESPVIELIRLLRDDGVGVRVYDPDIHLDDLFGTNNAYLQTHLPEANTIIRETLADALAGSDCVVVTQKRDSFREAIRELADIQTPIAVIDLA